MLVRLSLAPTLLIAGSVGPYGASLHDGSEYTGSYMDKVSKETILSWHRPRIMALMEEGVDLLAIETIPTLDEAELLLELIRDYPEQKAWLSFQCKVSLCFLRGIPKKFNRKRPCKI